MAESSAYTLRESECGKAPGQAGYGYTASGEYVEDNWTIAAPKHIPLHTIYYIPSRGWGEVQDRGGYIKNNRIDLYTKDLMDARRWGRRDVTVYEYPPESFVAMVVRLIHDTYKD